MTIIALSGKSGSGKDAFAKFVCERGYERRAFADLLKQAAGVIFGFSDAQLYGAEKNTVDPYWDLTPRDVLQRFGTEAMRNTFGPDVWIRALRRTMDPAGHYVITDMRFQSEAIAMQNAGARMVRIERPNSPCALTGAAATHPSETDLDHVTSWDVTIQNSGTMAELARVAWQWADGFRAAPFAAPAPAHQFKRWAPLWGDK